MPQQEQTEVTRPGGDCTCREGLLVTLSIILFLILLPFILLWSLLGLLLTLPVVVAVIIGGSFFIILAIIALVDDPFEWQWILAMALDLFVVSVLVVALPWDKHNRIWKSTVLWLLAIGAIIVGTIAITLYSQAVFMAVLSLATVTSTTTKQSQDQPGVDVVVLDGEVTTDVTEGTLMTGMNEAAILTAMLAIAWIVLNTHNLWLNVSEEQLVEAEMRVLTTMNTKKVDSFVVEGLGTLVVSDEDWPSPESYQNAGAGGAAPGEGGGVEGDQPIKPSGPHDKDKKKSQKPILVLVHGYAAANAYWAPVIPTLQEKFQVYCCELYGCGRSDRVPWTAKTPDEVLALFQDSMEKWRIAMQLESFVLLGHSLGSHACSAYAVKYPHRVTHLILASPAGVGLPPEPLRTQMVGSTWDYDFDTPSEAGSTISTASFKKNFPMSSVTYTFLAFCWDANFTPMDLVRWLGPLGHSTVYYILERRAMRSGMNCYLRKINPDQIKALVDFTYQNQALPPSGERVLAPMLMPGAYARKPLITWLRGKYYKKKDQYSSSPSMAGMDEDKDGEEAGVGDKDGGTEKPLMGPSSPARSRTGNSSTCVDGVPYTISCPVSLIYGSPDLDWMNVRYGRDLCEQLGREGVDAKVYQMKESGHIVYMEDPENFCDIVFKAVFARSDRS